MLNILNLYKTKETHKNSSLFFSKILRYYKVS